MGTRSLLVTGIALSAAAQLLAACGEARGPGSEAGATDRLSPKTALVPGRHHKVRLDRAEKEVYDQLRARGAVLRELDYGSFWVLVLDEARAGGAEALAQLPVALADDYNLVRIDGMPIDAVDPEATLARLPAALRKDRLGRAYATGERPPAGLYLVQFVGPVKDEWRASVEDEGLELVTYLPENAYVVRATDRSAPRLLRLAERFDFVQLVADYEPAFKVGPELRRSFDRPKLDLTVQLVDGPEVKRAFEALGRLATYVGDDHVSGPFRNVELILPSANMTALAGLDEVFAIEARTSKRLLDEAQGQIVAGNLAGNVPSGPGYLAWLASKGFASGQFGAFVVEIVDDSHAITGHPDLASGRVVFQNNPTNAGSTQAGHGFLNTHIVAGFNDLTGSAYEDASGYNYGVGIAPWARVGVTDIFGSTSVSASTWENTAYAAGARISSNSWGYVSVYRYDSNAQLYDRIVRDAQSGVGGLQPLAVVFAAGNDGPNANTIGSPGTAKNVLTVGASENVRTTGSDGCGIGNTGADSANDIISFSSRGPINATGGDGRVKPDLVAPGTHVQAGVPQASYDGTSVCNQYWPSGQTLYGWSSGTSHSTPAVAGASALVFQDFLNRGLAAPSPAMQKAYLMNATTRMTGAAANDTLPSSNQGMGRADLGRAFDTTARMLTDQTTVLGATGATFQVTGSVVDTSKPLRVTLAWSDAAGPTTGAPWVNNLDLTVTVGGVTYIGNVFSGGLSVAGGAADARNNVESVWLPAGTSGAFTVTVQAANIAGDGVPGNADTTDQDFALVVYNGSATTPSPTIGASPSSFTFTGTEGGASPAAQSLTVSNTGGGTLAFTATADQPWLSVSPASGTAPATLSLSANTAGLAVGTYTANLSLVATGATNSPLSLPVTLTVQAVAPATLGVSPASLAFSGTVGGASPAAQSLTVSNTGGGTLSFTAASGQSWLVVSPTAGTAPSTLTVSASLAGLAAGTYTDSIVITSAGATNTPVSVPVTFTVSAAVTDRVTNGGFEGSLNPWVTSGGSTGVTYVASGSAPHGGTGYVTLANNLGNVNSAVGQTITLPAGSTASLGFWLRITTSETTANQQNDRLFVEVRNASTGAVLATVATYSNLNAAAFGSYAQVSNLSLSAYAGQTVRIWFRTTTNRNQGTTFYLDDVSVR